MHTSSRCGFPAILLGFSLLVFCSAGAVLPAMLLTGTGNTLLIRGREERAESLQDATRDAVRTAGESRALRGLMQEGQQEFVLAEEKLLSLTREKQKSRQLLAAALARLRAFRDAYGVDPNDEGQIQAFIGEQRSALSADVRRYALAQFAGHASADYALARLLASSLSDRVQTYLGMRALDEARVRILASAQAMVEFPKELAALRSTHEALIDSYHAALDDMDRAERKIALSEERLEEIKRIAAEVDQRIQSMQADLAVYDERIRQRAESDLIALGLLGERRDRTAQAPTFLWPATGTLTATFLDPAYEAYFGIPHKAIDIAIPQGSIVQSAAEGVVHYVQYGGESGYSYVLVGHRDGYATLYGHLLDIFVTAGADIHQGQAIGLSGGLPGTPGAGPMTTGPHLHFEVIQRGVHLDPLMVLP